MSILSFICIKNAVKLITLLKNSIPKRFLGSFRMPLKKIAIHQDSSNNMVTQMAYTHQQLY